jgi:hypothetical protein
VIFIVKSKKILALMLSIILSIIIFANFIVSYSNNKLFNPTYQRSVYKSIDFYDGFYNFINNYLQDLSDNEDDDINKMVFLYMKKTFTKEVAEYNVDNFTEELFQYFDDKRSTLPDIYFKVDAKENDNYSLFDKLVELINIDKIGFNEVLVYINKTDIIKYFDILKNIYKVSNKILDILWVYIVLLIIIGLFLFISLKPIIYFLKLVSIELSILFISNFLIFKITSSKILNLIINNFNLNNNENKFLINYIKYIFDDIKDFSLMISFLYITLFIVFVLIERYIKKDIILIPFYLIKESKIRKILHILIIIIFILIFLFFLIISINNIKNIL